MKLKKKLALLLAAVLLTALLPLTALADGGSVATVVPGEVTFTKTATWNADKNEFTVTLTAKGEPIVPEKVPALNVVLVLDLSAGMNNRTGDDALSPTRLEVVRADAKSIVDKVFSLNADSKVALVGFGENVATIQDFTGSAETLNDVIDKANVPSDLIDDTGLLYNASNIAGGLYRARQLLDGKKNAVVVLLSDGGPTMGYPAVLDGSNIKVKKRSNWHMNHDIVGNLLTKNVYNYSETVGNGQNEYYTLKYKAKCSGCDYTATVKTSPLSLRDGVKYEAAQIRSGATLYTIAVDTSATEEEFLSDLASTGGGFKNYATGVRNALATLRETKAAGTNANVVDVMSDSVDRPSVLIKQTGAGATYDSTTGTLTWNISGDLTSTGATLSYTGKLKASALDVTADTTYPLNASATLSYTDYQGAAQTKTAASPTVTVKGTASETYNYTINYVEKGNTTNVLKDAVTGTATADTDVKPENIPAELTRDNKNYVLDSASTAATFTISATGENVFYIYYSEKTTEPEPETPTYSYTIRYLQAGYNTVLKSEVKGTAEAGTVLTPDTSSIELEDITYNYYKMDPETFTVTSDVTKNVFTVYYVEEIYNYTIKCVVKDSNPEIVLDEENGQASYDVELMPEPVAETIEKDGKIYRYDSASAEEFNVGKDNTKNVFYLYYVEEGSELAPTPVPTPKEVAPNVFQLPAPEDGTDVVDEATEESEEIDDEVVKPDEDAPLDEEYTLDEEADEDDAPKTGDSTAGLALILALTLAGLLCAAVVLKRTVK